MARSSVSLPGDASADARAVRRIFAGLALALAACDAAPASSPAPEVPALAPPDRALGCDPAAWTADPDGRAVPRVGDPDGRCDLRFEAARRWRWNQDLDLSRYAGRRIRVHGWGRVDAVSSTRWALLRLRTRSADAIASVGVDILDRGHVAWRPVDLCLDVPKDSLEIVLGLALPAGTEATLGGLTVTDVGEAAPPAPDARPVQRPDHLAAFARLFGALRFFYPAQAGGDEWHALAIAGVAAAERARDPAELAHVLEAWAQAIGPAIHIYPGRAGAPDPTFGPLTPGWHHFGVAGESAAFQSAFVGADDDHPAGAVERDLGLGLAVRFPRAFPGQNVAHRLARPPARDACAVRDDPRGERLATMITVWSVMEHFHPNLDVLPIDWSAALPPALDDAARVTDPDALVHAIQRLLAPLQDAGAWVDHEARLRSPLPLSWRCLGDDLVIDAVSAGERRLRPGDIVETIDGVPAIDLLRAAEAESSAATPAARRWQAATRLRVDAAGPTTALGLRDPTGARRSVTLEHTRPVDLFRRSYPPIRRVDGDVAVVELHRLDDDARARLPRDLADARGVVFDLRAHVGGSWRFLGHLVDDARPIAGWQKIETVLPGRAATRLHTTAGATLPAIAPRLRVPVAFLADARTGPEGERMLALVAAFELGAIVGETTMGAHCRDNGVWIPDGTFVRWTACRDLAPDGTPAVAGVAPTIPVQPTAADLAAGRDPVLDAAVAHLRAAAR